MKKIKQILAMIGIILLVSLYVVTVVLALTDDPHTMNAFRASVYCTFLIPVLIWAYSFIYKLLKNNDENKPPISMTADDDKKKAEE